MKLAVSEPCDRCGLVCDVSARFCHRCGQLLANSLIGSLLGERYRIRRFIGAGGMGRVYEALHVSLLKPVAIKVLAPEFATNAAMLRRFRREALAASRLAHPNVAQTLDMGTDGDQVYIAMELAIGTTLEPVIAAGASMARSVDLLAQVANALGAAHEAGVVHRDIKPANVMVTQVGRHELVKVVDFGLASLRQSAPDKSMLFAAAGTPTYVSPEAVLGRPIDARADVYSLGVVAYELIGGVPPFVSESANELFEQHAHRQPPSLRSRGVKRCSPELDQLISRMLAKSPNDRPQNGDVVYERLLELLPASAKLSAIQSRNRAVLVICHQSNEPCDVLAATVSEHGGELGRIVGDDAIATFASAESAASCAIDLTHEKTLVCAALDFGVVEMGAGGGVFGTTVNTAMRLARLAAPGEALATDSLREELGRGYRLPLSGRFDLVGRSGARAIFTMTARDQPYGEELAHAVSGRVGPDGAVVFTCPCAATNLVPPELVLDDGDELRCRCKKCSQPLRVRQQPGARRALATPVSQPVRNVLSERASVWRAPAASTGSDDAILADLSAIAPPTKEQL